MSGEKNVQSGQSLHASPFTLHSKDRMCMKIALIPIDNRPVCYNLAKDIANIDDELELLLPDRRFLGGLKSIADADAILEWIKSIGKVDAIVVSLDTIAYGGLIPSRRSKDSISEIKSRLKIFKETFEGKIKIYAFSSIMRISNNNINEEEKEYWDKYGKEIFEYSYTFHKEALDMSDVPQEILNDYLATRRRNFEINKMYLEWLEEGFFDTLVFSKDDCAEYGFNVMEAQILQKIIIEKNLCSTKKSVFIKTGADEIPLTLFARAIVDFNNNYKKAPKISTEFLVPEDRHLISNYEDISIEQCVQAQLELANCEITEEKDSDIILLINNFEEQQGEIVMGIKTNEFLGKFDLPPDLRINESNCLAPKPFMIADVRFANGADNKFVSQLLKKKPGSNFYGYSAWNTSANTLGSLICAGIVRFFAKSYNKESFNKLQMIRFLDDWAYQANIRQVLRKEETGKRKQSRVGSLPHHQNRPDFRKLKKAMQPFERKLSNIFNLKSQIKYKFPWKRFFEIEIIIR